MLLSEWAKIDLIKHGRIKLVCFLFEGRLGGLFLYTEGEPTKVHIGGHRARPDLFFF